jgi:hypothetical protein
MIFIPGINELPGIWINLSNVNLIYQFDDRLVLIFCDKSRVTVSQESMAIVLEALKDSQIQIEPMVDLSELID